MVGGHLNTGARFFPGFARSACRRALADLQVAGGQRPQAAARLDGPPAQQQPPLVLHNAAHHLYKDPSYPDTFPFWSHIMNK